MCPRLPVCKTSSRCSPILSPRLPVCVQVLQSLFTHPHTACTRICLQVLQSLFTQLQGAVQVAAASKVDAGGLAGEGDASTVAGEAELGEVAFASLRSAYGVA